MRLSSSATRSALFVFTACVSLFLLYHSASAGTLTPSATPAATSYTLADIYTRLTTNATTTAANHSVTTSTSPAATYYTLTQLYNAIPTITATTVQTGISYLGVAGTGLTSLGTATSGQILTGIIFSNSTSVNIVGAMADNGAVAVTPSTSDQTIAAGFHTGGGTVAGDSDLLAANIVTGTAVFSVTGTFLGNMFNGSTTTAAGGSQDSGGIDDYNGGGGALADRYATSWTACASGNNYCGTGLASADAKDNATGLVWSQPCKNSGCSTFSDNSPTTYRWNNSGPNNDNMTAAELCSGGDHAEGGWSLPHQKQLIEGYIDGVHINVEAQGTSRDYWSATTYAASDASAWSMLISFGDTNLATKASSNLYIRCVRPAS